MAAIFVDLLTMSNFLKSEDFSFEREMRLFYSTTDRTTSQLKIKQYKRGNASIPFVLMNLRDPKTNRLPLSEIRIGPKASFEEEKRFLHNLLNDFGYGETHNDRPNIYQSS